MFTRRALLLTAALGALFSSCGYVTSGVWANDSSNWARAFGTEQPAHARVVNSLYWRSPHFTYEAAYWFELEPSAEFEHELFAKNDLLRIEAASERRLRELRFQGHSLDWFAPKRGANAYEIWGWPSASGPSEFRLLIDRETRAIFMADRQL